MFSKVINIKYYVLFYRFYKSTIMSQYIAMIISIFRGVIAKSNCLNIKLNIDARRKKRDKSKVVYSIQDD